MASESSSILPFEGHLDVLRKMLLRIVAIVLLLAAILFYFKDETFTVLLAPSEWDFITYRSIEKFLQSLGFIFHFNEFHVDLISTELSSQFMTHLSTSLYLGLLCASPYILYEVFRFVSPALYESEKKYSVQIVIIVYLLFVLGVLMSYYIIFPISFRFLGTYSVSEKIHSTITLDSYISTFVTLTLVMGIVFQLPIITYILAKLGMISAQILANYRKHAIIVIMLVAAIITPPDIMTLLLVSLPLYLLFEVSIHIIKHI